MISHIKLGLHVMRKHPMGFFGSLSFLFGSIQPDICFLSYFCDVEPGDERRGHSYSTAIRRIQELESKLSKDSITALYVLGKIVHYAADSFTYPHNTSLFHGTLKEHMRYERILDETLSDALESERYSGGNQTFSEVSSFVTEWHSFYEKHEPSAECDVSYIVSIVFMIVASFGYVSEPAIKRTVAVR